MTMFRGSLPALITPFRNGKVDEKAFQDFVEWQIQEGSHGLVPCGTTGESPTLSHDEHKRVVELCVEVAKGRVPVIAGTGSNSTAEAIELTKHAKRAGADGALVVTPYYNKPTQEGLLLHYRAIADAVEIPILIYNIPGRSVIDMSHQTMVTLAKHPNIVGVKDASNDLARPVRVRADIGPEFVQLSGEDPTSVAFLAQGGVGCISVTANVAPRLCAQLQDAWQLESYEDVFRIRDVLMPLHDAMFVETNPGPAKFAAYMLGKCTAETRLPLAPLSVKSQARIEEALRAVGLITD
jgi:4-hydroxy-tetrahydrodipicolinate synthase